MSEIRIRFDGPPGPESGRFIEVENEYGESISFGEWKEDGGDWVLEFPNQEGTKDRLKAAEDVVAHLVIWGASPTDNLVELVEKSMALRMRDGETLCVPSAVKAALTARNNVLAWALEKIASLDPVDFEPGCEYGDWDNRGDIYSYGVQSGKHECALIAKAALKGAEEPFSTNIGDCGYVAECRKVMELTAENTDLKAKLEQKP